MPDTITAGEPPVTVRRYAAAEPANALIVLAHGAGAGQESPFMVRAAQGLAARGIDAVTFNFPYMERRAKLPNPAPQLERCYRDVIGALETHGWLRSRALFIGGKSMGGRMATHLAADREPLAHPLAGVVLLGYPLHPPGRPAQLRAAHLPAIEVPVLVVQGTRDAFGGVDEVRAAFALLGSRVTFHAVEGGDHSFRVTGLAKADQPRVLEDILDAVSAWVRERAGA
ncbi:MAG TPA: alpha/beta family hydrolase [Vicinamibacterales bacterium]